MKHKRLRLPLCMIALLAVAPFRASAQLIVNESFDYPVGVVLTNQEGGLGFAGPWIESGATGSDLDDIRSGSLPFNFLASSGNSLRSRAPGAFFSTLTRSLASPLLGTSGTVWMSFLMRKDSEGTTNPPENYFGLVLYPSQENAPALFIGDTGETDFYSLGIAGSAAAQAVSTVPSGVSASATLLVVKITFSAGPEVVQLFVNPPLGPAPTAPAATKSDLQIPDISSIGLLAGLNAQWSADEVRIGRTYLNVAPPLLRITAISKLPGNVIRVQGTGLPSQMHTVQATDSLLKPFVPLRSVMADGNGKLSVDDTPANPQQYFYRFAYP